MKKVFQQYKIPKKKLGKIVAYLIWQAFTFFNAMLFLWSCPVTVKQRNSKSLDSLSTQCINYVITACQLKNAV